LTHSSNQGGALVVTDLPACYACSLYNNEGTCVPPRCFDDVFVGAYMAIGGCFSKSCVLILISEPSASLAAIGDTLVKPRYRCRCHGSPLLLHLFPSNRTRGRGAHRPCFDVASNARSLEMSGASGVQQFRFVIWFLTLRLCQARVCSLQILATTGGTLVETSWCCRCHGSPRLLHPSSYNRMRGLVCHPLASTACLSVPAWKSTSFLTVQTSFESSLQSGFCPLETAGNPLAR
jgi:hypothetical protein